MKSNSFDSEKQPTENYLTFWKREQRGVDFCYRLPSSSNHLNNDHIMDLMFPADNMNSHDTSTKTTNSIFLIDKISQI